MSLIVDSTMRAIQQGLDLRDQREKILTANIANVDTPQFVPMDLENDGHIPGVSGPSSWGKLSMSRDAARHMAANTSSALVLRSEPMDRPDATSSLDQNRVDIDKQVSKFADNAVRTNATAELARRRFALLNYTIGKMSGGA